MRKQMCLSLPWNEKFATGGCVGFVSAGTPIPLNYFKDSYSMAAILLRVFAHFNV